MAFGFGWLFLLDNKLSCLALSPDFCPTNPTLLCALWNACLRPWKSRCVNLGWEDFLGLLEEAMLVWVVSILVFLTILQRDYLIWFCLCRALCFVFYVPWHFSSLDILNQRSFRWSLLPIFHLDYLQSHSLIRSEPDSIHSAQTLLFVSFLPSHGCPSVFG